MFSDVMTANLVSHLRQLVRERDPFLATQGHFYVQHYIQQQLGYWGEVKSHPFRAYGGTYYNWSLTIPPLAPTRKAPILIGAHYDAVPNTVGADDNATGVAVLLELARLFSQHPARRPIILVAFDLEEYGLGGSQAYVQQLQMDQQPLHLMLSLEMLGYCDPTPGAQRYPNGLQYFYPHQGDFIALIGNWRALLTMRHLQQALHQVEIACEWLPMIANGQPLPTARRSDHAPFWDAGYNAILVTDTADLRNPHYHRPSDTLETLDLNFLAGICWGLFQGVSSL
jgi:aminopeptidase YwaD